MLSHGWVTPYHRMWLFGSLGLLAAIIQKQWEMNERHSTGCSASETDMLPLWCIYMFCLSFFQRKAYHLSPICILHTEQGKPCPSYVRHKWAVNEEIHIHVASRCFLTLSTMVVTRECVAGEVLLHATQWHKGHISGVARPHMPLCEGVQLSIPFKTKYFVFLFVHCSVALILLNIGSNPQFSMVHRAHILLDLGPD